MRTVTSITLLITATLICSGCSLSADDIAVRGPCDAEVPATWHVRSAANQEIWNREGNVLPPAVLTADMVMESLRTGDAVPFKPAVFSIADGDTTLVGHSEDPGAEDANRFEIDVLKMPGKEAAALYTRLRTLDAPLNFYYATPVRLGNRDALKIRNINSGKYYGLELVIIAESSPGAADGFVFYNRSNDAEMNVAERTPFRVAAERFFETLNPAACPAEWVQQ